MSAKKKPTIDPANLDKVLEQLPPEQRENARAAVLDAFKDFDPKNPPGKPVRRLPKGTTVCPTCGKPLKRVGHTITHPVSGQVLQFFECRKCDEPFSVEAPS